MRLPHHHLRPRPSQQPHRARMAAESERERERDHKRRKRAEQALKAVVDRYDAERLPLNPSRHVIDAMGGVLARLVAKGVLSEDAVQAEIMEREATLLRAAFAEALQRREDAALRTR